MPLTRPAAPLGCLALAGVLLGGCAGDDPGGAGEDPAGRLEQARAVLDEADSLQVRLATDSLPDDTQGLVEADGVGTHAPAFEGTVTVRAGALGEVDADVVSLDGDVLAKIGFAPAYAPIDPADYGAPDPARLVDPDDGVSSWLTATDGLDQGEQSRDGEQVLTTLSGTLPGEVVQELIPSADDTADFAVDYRLTDDDVLSDATIVGPFYAGVDDVTYTLDVTASDEPVEITRP